MRLIPRKEDCLSSYFQTPCLTIPLVFVICFLFYLHSCNGGRWLKMMLVSGKWCLSAENDACQWQVCKEISSLMYQWTDPKVSLPYLLPSFMVNSLTHGEDHVIHRLLWPILFRIFSFLKRWHPLSSFLSCLLLFPFCRKFFPPSCIFWNPEAPPMIACLDICCCHHYIKRTPCVHDICPSYYGECSQKMKSP